MTCPAWLDRAAKAVIAIGALAALAVAVPL